MFEIGQLIRISRQAGCNGKVWEVREVRNDGGVVVKNINDPRTKGPLEPKALLKINR